MSSPQVRYRNLLLTPGSGDMFATPRRSTGSGIHGATTSGGGVFLSPATHRQQNVPGCDDGSVANSPLFLGSKKSDADDRKERRKSRVIELQQKGGVSPISPTIDRRRSLLTLPGGMTNAQLSEHYSTCIKLSTENKITTKNAFGLHLIDYMADLCKQKGTEMTNFQMAAGTLDASTKIYAVRVDSVHADAYKMLGDIAGNSQTSNEQQTGDGEENPENGVQKGKQKQRKKNSVKNIETNLDKITNSKFDVEEKCEPLLKTGTSYDECGTMGLLLNNLKCSDYSCNLLFDCDLVPLRVNSKSTPPTISSLTDFSELRGILQQSSFEDKMICPSMASFLFNQCDNDTSKLDAMAMLEKLKGGRLAFDMDAEPQPLEDDYEDDDNDGGGDFGVVGDDFNGDNGEGGTINEFRSGCVAVAGKSNAVMRIENAGIEAMRGQLSLQPSEYSYFDPKLLSTWAGPDHWRLKPTCKVSLLTDKNGTKIPKVKKTFSLDFDQEINLNEFKQSKAATTITKTTVERYNMKSTTLPDDFHYDPENLIRAFLRPSLKLMRVVRADMGSNHDDDIAAYNYNNANDAANYCPALPAADDDDDDNDAGPAYEPGQFNTTDQIQNFSQTMCLYSDSMNNNATPYGGDNLVAEPHKVNKIQLDYAKTAKKMDVKRLKQNIWNMLTMQEGDMNNTNENEDAKVSKEILFSEMYKKLPARLPISMSKNLSVPMAFVCLLHLANEKNLVISGQEDLLDLKINQDLS
ncbi:condensin complex subunit 2 [Petromyzon marinus]|uniref:Condensin complex subunit 2 n=1 Tax=Petromyzon marinus TaxID=7757 RepID=A0AAJ7SYP9_PETMA|nr:condensin complex subunit 2 [Petromyzon marinus]